MITAFDEMHAADGAVRDNYRSYAEWLQAMPAEVTARKRVFHRVGITFAVYGEDAGTERLIPFDIVPRIIPAAEWKQIEAGLRQRVKALKRSSRRLPRPGNPQGRPHPRRAGAVQQPVPARDAGRRCAGRHLCAHRRRRPGARRRRRVLRAGRQPAGARPACPTCSKTADDDAAVPRAVRAPAIAPVEHYPDLLLTTCAASHRPA
jgi:hypothetical protein